MRSPKRSNMKSQNSDGWIESIGIEPSEDVTKFHPLPKGEGRGEGKER